MSFKQIISQGIEKIYTEDLDNQMNYMKAITGVIRKREEIAPLLEAKAFVVPNSTYMREYFGPEIQAPAYDVYTWDGICVWENFLVFPIPNVAGVFSGFAGFDPLAKAMSIETGESLGRSKYRYSKSNVFNRSRYLYCLAGVYDKAVKEGYIVLTDGVFDMLYMHFEDIICGAMLGSSLSEEVKFLLSFIDVLYVAEDNDQAGRDLYTKLKSFHPCVKYLRQNVEWDSDDVLKGVHRVEYVRAVKEAIRMKSDMALRIKPFKRGST